MLKVDEMLYKIQVFLFLWYILLKVAIEGAVNDEREREFKVLKFYEIALG